MNSVSANQNYIITSIFPFFVGSLELTKPGIIMCLPKKGGERKKVEKLIGPTFPILQLKMGKNGNVD